MKSKIFLILFLFCILSSSASALTVSLSCRVNGNIIYCTASNTNATHYQWDWKHTDDSDFMSTGWVPVSRGNDNVFTCTKAGRHVIRLSAKNGSQVVMTQRGVDMHHGEKTREPLAVATTEEGGDTDPTPLGKETIDWFSKRTFGEMMVALIVAASVIVFLMILKDKKKVKK